MQASQPFQWPHEEARDRRKSWEAWERVLDTKSNLFCWQSKEGQTYKTAAGHWPLFKQISKVANQNLDHLGLNCIDGQPNWSTKTILHSRRGSNWCHWSTKFVILFCTLEGYWQQRSFCWWCHRTWCAGVRGSPWWISQCCVETTLYSCMAITMDTIQPAA